MSSLRTLGTFVIGTVLAGGSFLSAAPIVGNAPQDPALLAALGTSVGQVMESGGTLTGEILPSVYQPYVSGLTSAPPILVAIYSTTNTVPTDNILFAQPGSFVTINGSNFGGNIGGAGKQTPNLDTYNPGFNLVNFYNSSSPEFQQGTNDGLLIFDAGAAAAGPITSASLTLNTFFVESNFAKGVKLDVFVVNPALGLTPDQVTYHNLTLSAAPEPASLGLLACGAAMIVLRRRKQTC